MPRGLSGAVEDQNDSKKLNPRRHLGQECLWAQTLGSASPLFIRGEVGIVVVMGGAVVCSGALPNPHGVGRENVVGHRRPRACFPVEIDLGVGAGSNRDRLGQAI